MLFLHISSAFLISFCTAQTNVLSDEFIDSINKVQSFWRAGKVWPENTTREFLNRLSGSVDPKLFQHEHKGRILHPHQFRMRSDIPESFDLRHRWPQCTTIGKVRSQGYCGSCWALVPASVLTDRFCIASKGKVRFEFSAEDILTCCSRGCVSKRNSYCDGGRADKAWKFLIKEGGVSGGEYKSNEGCKPYPIEIFKADAVPGCRRACTNKNYPVPYSKDKRFVKYDTQIWTKSVSQIQTEIMDNGPVDAYMNVYKDFEVYREGVYSHTVGNKGVNGHSVKLIGWGVENDRPYWLGINTWGKKWGMEGVFKILRGVNECDIESTILTGQPDLDALPNKKRVKLSSISGNSTNHTSFGVKLSPRFVVVTNIFILYEYINHSL